MPRSWSPAWSFSRSPSPRVLALLLGALAILAGPPARAVDREDLPSGECHPPVQAVIDPDWRREAAAFRDTTLRDFARYLDSEAEAQRQLAQALQIAESTRAGAFDVIEMTKELFIRGFRDPDLSAVRWAALDAQARLGAELSARLLRVLGAVHQRGSFSVADLRDAAEIVPPTLLREALGRRLGLRLAGDEPAVRAGLDARIRDGIEAATAIAAVIEALSRQLQQAQPGQAARAALSSCITQMSRGCTRRAAEEHCKSTPREYLALMQGPQPRPAQQAARPAPRPQPQRPPTKP